MAQVLVKLDLNWSTKLVMDSKDADTLLNIIAKARVVEDRYDGYLVQGDNADVSLELYNTRKQIISKEKYDAMKAEAEQAKAEQE